MNGELESGPQRLGLEETVTQNFTEFLMTAEHGNEASSAVPSSSVMDRRTRSYEDDVKAMLRANENTLRVDFMDLQRANADLANVVLEHFYRLEPTLRAALNGVVANAHREMVEAGEDMHGVEDASHAQFFVGLHNLPAVQRLRDLRSAQVGKLASMSGTVTRTSEVRPELFYGAFECQECNTLVENVAQSFVYTEPPSCTQQACANRSKWTLVPSASVFVDWQKVRVQENADEIPAGSMPRSLDVILRADAVESVKPGDKAVLTGSMIAVPDAAALMRPGQIPKGVSRGAARRARDGTSGDGVRGLAQLGVRHLSYKLAFVATSVARAAARVGSGNSATVLDAAAGEAAGAEFVQRLPAAVRARVVEMQQMDGLYARMTRSVAPAVRGHDEVKRGVLLMLLGGVHKRTSEGINLRGDLNVCVVGDPSTAKSQFLKWVTQFMPRAIYTSGKASSAAGLTATVAKDPDTGEFCIEAGALMLADNGVCCIDEFDKMEPQDQVAIHEAMEQQTISITKAGIQATLNARASILAAANPVYGRYDRTKTLRQNVALTAPIMSRFDLFFIVLDECDETIDAEIARHIVSVHQRGDAAAALEQADFSLDDLRHYVAVARQVQPVLCPAAQLRLIQLYKRLRANDSVGAARASYRITVRQLESMVRLAEALARLHLSPVVLPEYVDEAYRLLRKSIIHVETTDAIELPAAADLPAMVRGAVRDASGRAQSAGGAGAAAGEGGTAAGEEGAAAAAGTEAGGETGAGAAAGGAGQMTFAEYNEMAAALVRHVLDTEPARGDGVRVGDIVEAHLEAMGLDDLEELGRQRRRVAGVVRRLRRVDRVLVLGAAAPLEVPDAEDDLVVTVHPHWGVN